MGAIGEKFKERLEEIEEYLSLLGVIESSTRENGQLYGSYKVNPRQQRILFSNVLLQLYNIVEATAVWCLEELVAAVSQTGRGPAEYTPQIRKEWVKHQLKLDDPKMTEESRLDRFVGMVDIVALPNLEMPLWRIEAGGGGNWEDEEIFRLAKRLGVEFNLPPKLSKAVKVPTRNAMRPLEFICKRRNHLAHGNISFAQSTESETLQDLITLKNTTVEYLEFVVDAFTKFIDSHSFLAEGHGPDEAA